MKQLNKVTRYLVLAITAVAISSCSKKTDDIPDKTDPKMLSFGFFAEDNNENVLRDYAITEVTGTNILIELPKDVDRTKLVARFTTTDNATVTVNGVPQQSKITANNFTTPVDFIVTEGQTNARYTVTIANAADYVWTRAGAYTDNTVGGLQFKIHPQTGVPHFFYMLSATNVDDRKAYVAKYQDNNWASIGDALSAGRVGTDLSMAFDNTGKLYIAYPDYTTTPTTQGPTVQSYNGTDWSVVGGTSLFPAQVTYSALGINPSDNQPILFNYVNTNNYAPFPRRAISVSYFNGTNWNIHNQITGRPSSQVGGITRSKTVDGVLYIAVYNNNVGAAHDYSVYTYKQNVWSTIADKVLEPGATNSNFRDFDMDVDLDGNIYIAISDDGETNGTAKPRVKKYNAATKIWSQVGNVINVNQGLGRYFSVAVSPSGIPHFLYRDEQELPVVITFDTETQDWGTPKVLENVKVKGSTNSMFIDFAHDGTGYVAYINETDNIVLHKYDAPSN
ncbi:hypothetical protein FAZ15_01225 [Sphingobacterium olei]|uniref:Cadherin-like beta sandwich domain-containing protein n=1 Tax=Sphingobacterium olei TaxID=2571155 RepID=A0A4U0P838_9SPHI|nr:hypothetical protein [Sphingobacterium olei]TJZ62952.1 hypothetical protein FAZ15_01225 [Sphingobacterium olei]